jgi:hypothetical protein
MTRSTSIFIAGAAATAITGLVVQAVVVPTTDVVDDRWSYPFRPAPFVAVTAVYLVLHVLVAIGLVGFAQSGVAGQSRTAQRGNALTIAGTLTLGAGEAASLPFRNAATDDTSALVVSGVFGLGILLSAIGFLVVGMTTKRAGVWRDWRRVLPLVTGIWCVVLLVVPPALPKFLPGSVAVYGACLLAIAVATRSASAGTAGAV